MEINSENKSAMKRKYPPKIMFENQLKRQQKLYLKGGIE